MNLIIDVGNTLIKLAVFEENKLIEKTSIGHRKAAAKIKDLLKEYRDLNKAIISSVGKKNKDVVKVLKKNLDLLKLSSKSKIPFENEYSTPKTLGVDRIALVSASVEQFPDNNVLIIDAGTCVTYDFINFENQYLGGAISPGLKLRYQSLHNLTANLPLLELENPDDLIGNSTVNSIHSGVVNGLISEIDGIIDRYLEKYPDLTVILTGGDADFLAKRLKNSIFANSNFLLEGLNFILEYNTN
ncbi:MAG: type III pantothenate kinase [Flavobacteriaceae bacterium]|nr:type III pantothenate kinase [Bacteroidia bacterium]NND12288.1 type III pantothenate kinase [Flavobacteriaceae bacterium]NNK28034.1 type III pantothenate kinase [Flavobacteriaceae bacterium]NNL60779.1 type III pantothenate kinase [Flavobacteriaceae bacterium]